jgi:1,4-alpha-glucan branching enzyme
MGIEWTPDDDFLFQEGTHSRLYEKLGAHADVVDGVPGVRFRVWAPHARRVVVIGDFNAWNNRLTPMHPVSNTGLWNVFVPSVRPGSRYKFQVIDASGLAHDKADPFAFGAETQPGTASEWCDTSHRWSDGEWLARRHEVNTLRAPIAVYEVHLGSWRRSPDHPDRFLSYGQIAADLIPYVLEMGFTHVEFLPWMEHPFYGSWGYQVSGYFAPTRRYGDPSELKGLIDALHRAGIGVILDWVPGHFPADGHGLAFFDGTHLFEHADPRQGFHPEWKSLIFNYGRGPVRSFLVSSALYWLREYHLDGLRIDGVASMLYLDYARKPGEWIPNAQGGRENWDAVRFLRAMNTAIRAELPHTLVIAEDSTAWPKVTHPVPEGGLGFDLKWDMGWMHDTLDYLRLDPLHRKHHHNSVTFRSIYASHECFQLPLSHDEVVHGKYSLLRKMHGDAWQQYAHLRLLFGYQFAQPGKKLLFMGGEFAHVSEWNHDTSLDWHLMEQPPHVAVRAWTSALLQMYARERALHEGDCVPEGFEWLDGSDVQNSVITFLRRAPSGGPMVLVACNFTPVPRPDYWIGVPLGGAWTSLLSSDDALFGGTGQAQPAQVRAASEPWHGRPYKLRIDLPPLGICFFRSDDPARRGRRRRKLEGPGR